MAFGKITTFTESLVEPDQDANTALTDLDKGLRSGKIGEQCDAIVRFPRLFEKFPFPILINSSVLKLADVFRGGNNFLRLWVLRVCQQSEKHLDKVLNVDEFVRRIYSVIHSNDPVARALTLRTLGAIAGIIPERQQVHHSIRSSLDSHDAVEVEAAIVAAKLFAAQSKKFAVSMCNKVAEMIQGLATPSHRKLQLIPILQHMHHDASTASMVRYLCKRLLIGYPAEDFVLITLSTLTQLAAATLVDIPQQVTLLVEYLRDDPRWMVKAGALEGLRRLAREGACLWPKDAVTNVVQVAYSTDKPALLSSALDVLTVLVSSARTCHDHVSENSPLLRLARKCCVSGNSIIAAKAIKILASVISYRFEEKLSAGDMTETIKSIESLFLLSTYQPIKLMELQSCLQAMMQLCRASPDLAEQFVLIISRRLFISDDNIVLLSQALGAIGGQKPIALRPIISDIVEKLRKISRQAKIIESDAQTQVLLCTLLFQYQLDHEWDVEVRHAVVISCTCDNNWANFRIARAAARYGHHDIAQEIFGRLKNLVASEHLYFWLTSLEELSKAESALHWDDVIINRLSASLSHHCKALASLKAANTPSQSLQFQVEYVKVRCEFLQCMVQLVHTCHSFCTTPPPAIAASTYVRDELQRYNQVTTQLLKSVTEFRECSEMYQKLYQSAFDADPESLANIQVYQQICLLVANSIEKVCLTPIEEFQLDIDAEQYGLEIKYLVHRCRATQMLIGPIINNREARPITHQHIEALIQCVQVLAETSFCMPRFYFQTLQSTSLKLNISPLPRITGESIVVQGGQQLAIKVEGVTVHGLRPGKFRKTAAVIVTLHTLLQARQHSLQDIKSNDAGSTVTQSVIPHRDFFTAQFLIAFPTGGQYTLNLDAAIADENGHIWKTGPKSTLSVKYHEDTKSGSAQIAARSFAPPRQY